MLSVDNKVLSRIYGLGRGPVVSPNDFLDLGNRNAVGLALYRLVKKGTIRRLARGLYDYPRKHPHLGLLSPTPDAIGKALARKGASRLQPSGAYAANLLGLSEQVPARVVFLTDGPSRNVKVSNWVIQMRKTTTKNMATAGRTSGLVIQALRHIGKQHMDAGRVQHLRRALSQKDKKQLLKDVAYAPAWMQPIFRQIALGGTFK